MSDHTSFHPLHDAVPRHVGIIPDGGRRWAQRNHCALSEAYRHSRIILQSMTETLLRHGIAEISIYLSSIQNFRRTSDEMAANMEIIYAALTHEIKILAGQQDLKVIIAGNRALLPEKFTRAVETLERLTAGNARGRLNLLIAYDPILEISEAVSHAPSPNHFTDHLWITTPVDLILRTGGANLLSNFLPLQSGYARIHCFEQLFNDLTTRDLEQVLADFCRIDRKFGT